jgi:hypothetical protein
VVLRVTLFSNSSDEDPTFCTQVGLVVCIILWGLPRLLSLRSLRVLDRGNAYDFPSRSCALRASFAPQVFSLEIPSPPPDLAFCDWWIRQWGKCSLGRSEYYPYYPRRSVSECAYWRTTCRVAAAYIEGETVD